MRVNRKVGSLESTQSGTVPITVSSNDQGSVDIAPVCQITEKTLVGLGYFIHKVQQSRAVNGKMSFNRLIMIDSVQVVFHVLITDAGIQV